MKKILPLIFAVSIVIGAIAATAHASGIQEEAEGDQITDKEQVKEVAEELSQLEKVEELTLEDVIHRGTENSVNLAVLQLELEMSKNDFLLTKTDHRKTERQIKDLKNSMDKLREQEDTFDERKDNLEEQEALREKIKALELAIQQFESGELHLQLEEEAAKNGVRLMLTTAYTDLLLQEDWLVNMNKSFQSSIKNLEKFEILYKFGRVSEEELRQIRIAHENAEKQLEEQEKNLNYAVAALCYDIGVSYNPEVKINSLEIDPVKVETPSDISLLIENSLTMKSAQKNLENAILNRDQTYEDYEKRKATKYEKENQEHLVTIAEKNIVATENDLRNQIEQLYRNGENSYTAYQEAVRQLEITKVNLGLLEVRYNLGRVSRFDFEQAQLKLEEAQLRVFETKVQNYIVIKTIEAMEKGYI
ncbi:TolC family protein [Bacillus dakarensis]|uniref:TolC family protein n=1 Tax=Robertmurraya dakarensis TaxID=1926278 RepID=UPI00098134FB|nr:TolC family protein [Bacillus dakarensis]